MEPVFSSGPSGSLGMFAGSCPWAAGGALSHTKGWNYLGVDDPVDQAVANE